MDAIIVSEIDKIRASIEVIEAALETMEDFEPDPERRVRSEFPPMPFPAFDEDPQPLPI